MTNVFEFEWDEGNRDKNWLKHRVTAKECEEVFNNGPLLQFQDIVHSVNEERWIVFGRTNTGRKLQVTLTVRSGKIRVISARDQNRRERKYYESKKGDNYS